MFKKTILTISALALSAGMLVSASSTDAEAARYSRYIKTQLNAALKTQYQSLGAAQKSRVDSLIR